MYKKWWFWVIAFFGVMIIYGAIAGVSGAKEEIKAEVEKPKEVKKEKEEPKEEVQLERDEEIQALVKSIVEDKFVPTDINKIAVNENMGLDDGSYIVLPHLTWNVQNREKLTREMLEQYSNHLAAVLAKESDVSEITVFWEVPYHLEGSNVAKFNFTREGDEMMIGEVWYDPIIRE